MLIPFAALGSYRGSHNERRWCSDRVLKNTRRCLHRIGFGVVTFRIAFFGELAGRVFGEDVEVLFYDGLLLEHHLGLVRCLGML